MFQVVTKETLCGPGGERTSELCTEAGLKYFILGASQAWRASNHHSVGLLLRGDWRTNSPVDGVQEW
jgi:hypothetical protein